MNWIYNLTAHVAYFILFGYSLFSGKIKKFIQGRRVTFQKLSVLKEQDKVVWFHAASLGEFEQARPIIEEIKKEYPAHKIVVTFFSPSGYEIRKNYSLADVVCYLPFDTRRKMKRFVECIHPDLAVIIKYEFWPNLLSELKAKRINTVLVSGIFRENQPFFKKRMGWMRKTLTSFDFFFLQNKNSQDLLSSIGLTNTEVVGDTRFDRVSQILEQNNKLDFIEQFKNNTYTQRV